jgi:hypothetical protein
MGNKKRLLDNSLTCIELTLINRTIELNLNRHAIRRPRHTHLFYFGSAPKWKYKSVYRDDENKKMVLTVISGNQEQSTYYTVKLGY